MSGSAVGLVSDVSQCVRGRLSDGSDIEPLMGVRPLRGDLVRILSRNSIGARAQERTHCVAGAQREGLTSGQRKDRVYLPVAQNAIHDFIAAIGCLAASERDVVHNAIHKSMPNIPSSVGVFARVAGHIRRSAKPWIQITECPCRPAHARRCRMQ